MKDFSIELIELVVSFCESSQDKASLCLVNKLFYSVITRLLYQRIMITGPRNYLILRDTLSQASDNRQFVHCLDFSSYTTRGSRWSEEKAKGLVKAGELSQLIKDCEHLKELLIGEEMMHASSSPVVLDSILSKRLTTLDFLGFTDKKLLKQPLTFSKGSLNLLKNVSFFMCTGLSQEYFFIPFFRELNGNQLEKLDMSFTQINSSLFSYLNNTRTLTHLNLQGCYSLTCCSPLITFIEQNAHTLVELNLNIKHSRFCSNCLYRIISCLNHNQLKSLNLSGHTHCNDMLLQQVLLLADESNRIFHQLQYFAIDSTTNITLSLLHKFINRMFPQLFYLQLPDPLVIPYILQQQPTTSKIQVIESNLSKKYPKRMSDWQIITYGNRSYYTKHNVNPRHVYSKKLILLDQLSPMNKYWSYST